MGRAEFRGAARETAPGLKPMSSTRNHLHWLAARHSVGVAAIDEQHREIAVRLNRVIDHVVEGAPCETLIALFDDLLAYVAEHFAYEESLMNQYGYPDTAAHVSEHRLLLQQLDNIVRRDPCNLFNASLAPAFLIDWVERHALEEDMRLSRYLIAQGLN